MPRGVVPPIDEQIEMVRSQITKFDEKIEEINAKKKEFIKKEKELLKIKEETDMADILNLVKTSGKSIEEIKAMLSNQPA